MAFRKTSKETIDYETKRLVDYTKDFYKSKNRLPMRRDFKNVTEVKNARWIDRYIEGKIYGLYKLAGFSEEYSSKLGIKKKGHTFAEKLFKKEGAITDDEKRSLLISFALNLIGSGDIDKDRVVASCFKGFSDRPSIESIQKYFGTWSKFLKECGIKSKRRKYNMTDKEYREYFENDIFNFTNVRDDCYGSLVRWQEITSEKYDVSKGHLTNIAKNCQYIFKDCDDLFDGIEFKKNVYFGNEFVRYFIPDRKIGIDIVNLSYGSESGGKKKGYFFKKKKNLSEIGVNYFCFYESEVRSGKFEIIRSIINFKIGNSKKIGARKCFVKSVGKSTARKFFNKNHLMGNGKGEVIGLWQGKTIQSAIQITHHKKYIEIDRFCTKIGTQVHGALSKLVKEIERRYNPQKIVSFVDGRYGDGHSLNKIGFTMKTNYPSFKWTNGKEIKSRRYYLSNTGVDFGFSKIWDCGQMRFEKIIHSDCQIEEDNKTRKVPAKKERAKMRSRNDFEYTHLNGSLKENQDLLIKIGLEMYHKLGRKIKAHDFRGLGIDHPTDNIIIKYFDNSWNKFIEATGINELEKNRIRLSFIKFTNNFVNKNNKFPTNKQYTSEFNYSKLLKFFPDGGLLKLRSLCNKPKN